jgi:hypothetical protein
MEHSDLGPSALSRVLACPGSFMLSQRPEVKALTRRASVYAARGTVAHRVAEGVLEGQDPTMGVTTQAGHDIDVDDAMVAAVNIYTELVETFIALSDWHVIEQRVSLDEYWHEVGEVPPIPIFGTTDFAGYHASIRLLRIIDYKHGSGVFVKVEENPQPLAYAAGALRLCPGPVSEIEITIVQPNAPGAPIRTARISIIDLLLWVREVLMPGIARAQAEPDTYVAGSQCRFCPGAALCPLIAQAASEEAMQQFKDTGSPEELARALDRAELAELWIKSVRELAKSQLEEGVELPGWTLVPTRPVRSWDNPDEVSRMLAAFDDDEVYEVKLRSPAQLQKWLPGATWKLVEAHVQHVSSSTKLARTSAP